MAKLIAYHGTSTIFLDGILEHGVVPKPSRKSWEADPDAAVYTQSRVSLPGSYWATNLMTAISSSGHTSRKLGGESMIVIMAFNPDSPSIVPDEDTIRYKIQNIVIDYLSDQGLFYIHLEYYTDVIGYIDALEAYAELEGDETSEWIANAADKLLHNFFNDFVNFAVEKFAVKPSEDLPDEELGLWIELLRAHAVRRSSYQWTKARVWDEWRGFSWREESFYDYRRHYSRGVELASWQIQQLVNAEIRYEDEDDWAVWEQMNEQRNTIKDHIELIERELVQAVCDLELRPISSEVAETTYLGLLDQITRAYPHWAKMEILDPRAGVGAFRMLEPVGFSGENRIVAIVEFPRDQPYRVGHLLYGDTLPEHFVAEYLRRMADSLTVLKDGTEVAQYGG